MSARNNPTPNNNKLTPAEQLANMALAHDDFVWFVKEIIGATPWDYQEVILRDLCNPDVNRIAWHTSHGVGKTTTMAWCVCAYLFTRPNSIVVTTASVNRHVREILWPEIHRWMNKAKPNLYKIGWKWPYNVLDMKIEISSEKWFAIGASSDTPENMEGFHADHLLYIVDEAKTVEKSIFASIDGALTSKVENKLMVVSTPSLGREGHFYEICSGRYKGWNIYHTSAIDCPNVNQKWVEEKREEWGENSPLFISKVMGEFPDASENTLIPASWVEKAFVRHRFVEEVPEHGAVTIGVDPARYGDDETVIAYSKGNYVFPLECHTKQDTMQTAGQVIRSIENHQATQVNIDVVGLGAGVYDRVSEIVKARSIRCALKPVNAGGKAPSIVVRGERLRFKRYRDYLYWNMREMLDPINCNPDDLISLPPDERLRQQLTSIRYKINSDGTIEIESKDDLKKRGYTSPDRAEAVMCCVAKGYEGWATIIR